MKKLNYLLLGCAGLLLASCANDDIPNPSGDGTFQIRINLPSDLATRATYGEGTAPKDLQYAVFQAQEDGSYANVLSDYESIGTDLTVNLTLNLLAGKNYELVLFAQSQTSGSEGVYTFDPADRQIKVNYSKMSSLGNATDSYDCFYANLELKQESSSYTVNMARPMAQINWGTSDINANQQIINAYGQNGAALQSVFKIKGASTAFDMLTGELIAPSNTEEFVTLPSLGIPNIKFYNVDATETEEFPVEGYEYIAMQYILVPASTGVYDAELSITGANADASKNITITGLPLQANYRTNIYGELLSSESDINIEITPDFGGENNQPVAWDGKTITIPDISADNITIARPSDLAGIAAIVNGENGQTANTLEGKTISLGSDIDLGGNSLTIGSATRNSSSASGHPFQGTLNGNGHTISNLNIEYTGDNGNAVAALIPNLDGKGTVKNLTFSHVSINGGAAEQAGIVGLVTNGATISGVTVSSGSITATEGAGGIAGRMIGKGTIDNCTNYADITVSAKNGGGIIGAAYYGNQGMTISNCKNYGKVVATAKVESIGGIVATCSADVEGCINYGPVGDSTIAAPAGGIVGYQISSGSIKNCTNEGTVMGAAEVAGIVAFIGNVTYAGYTTDIYVTGNTNNGTLNGSGTVGGILGINRNGCYLENNINDAPSMSGSKVAGIVGNAMQSGSSAEGYVWLMLNSSGENSNINKTPLSAMKGTQVEDIFTGTLYVGDVLSTNN